MQGWRSSLVSILSLRRIMVLMASFVTSQGDLYMHPIQELESKNTLYKKTITTFTKLAQTYDCAEKRYEAK